MRRSGNLDAVEGATAPPCLPVTNDGVALIAVLSLVALLSAIAIGVVGITRMRLQISARHSENIQATETIDSAIRLELLALTSSPESARPLIVNGQASHQVYLFDSAVDLTVDLESGRIDINFSDEATMTAAFVGNGFAFEEARTYAQRVLDWRDSDDIVTGSGAEREAYLREKLNYEPRNAPFESVGELRQVLGLENLTAAQLEAFTVYSHLPMPDERSSVNSVRKALEWMHARSSKSAAHNDANDSPQEDTTASPPRQADASAIQSVAGQVVRVRACVARKHMQMCRVAIVRFTGDINNPFLVFAWKTNFEDAQKVAVR